MRPVERLWMSSRRIRSRLIESILVITATAIGVALVAAMAAFMRSYNDQTESLLAHPAYREMVVETVGNETELSESVVAYDADVSSEAAVGLDDLELTQESSSLITYAYVADRITLSTELRTGRGGGMPVPGGSAEEASGAIVPASGAETATGEVSDFFAGTRGEEFDLEQFFSAEEGVVTELPVESFAGLQITPDYFSAYGLAVSEGDLITEEDVETGNNTLVLGSALATTLFPDGDAIGTRVRLGFETYTVIGILEPTGLTDLDDGTSLNTMAFVPSPDAQTDFAGMQRPDQGTSTLRFAVEDSSSLEQAAEQLEIYFETQYGEGAVHITAEVDALTAERDNLSRILAVVLFLAAASLFIASINLFNLMLMRVIKRTKSTGITRAIGATRREIFRQFLSESGLMSLVGAVIGLAVSPIAYNLLSTALIAGTTVAGLAYWPYLVAGAVAGLAFSVLFGVVPARQAANIEAAIAVKSE